MDTLHHVKQLLAPDEVIEPSSELYAAESLPWAVQKDLKPRLVARPKNLESLSKLLAYLAQTPLDFAVRSQGFGSASASDVLISLTAFDEFDFDRQSGVVTLGAGQTWSDYYAKMEKVAPDYSGVGGSILAGGFSWLSPEYGLTSDPQNMLDAQVVKLDGQIVWASTEPDLMWALRGAGASYGVVTTFKLRAYPYTTSILAGPIILPRNQLPQIAQAVSDFTRRCQDPKLSMFVYVIKWELLGLAAAEHEQDTLIVHVFDAYGEQHARSEDGFRWALEMEGAIDMTTVMNLRGVSNLQAHIGKAKGVANSYWSALALADLTKETIMRSFEWFDDVKAAGGTIRDNSYLLFETMQIPHAASAPSNHAWPRPAGSRHVLLLGTGCAAGASKEEYQLARKLISEGLDRIMGPGNYEEGSLVPNAIEDFHDRKYSYGENLPKLIMLKRKYDPGNKLKGPIMLAAAAN